MISKKIIQNDESLEAVHTHTHTHTHTSILPKREEINTQLENYTSNNIVLLSEPKKYRCKKDSSIIFVSTIDTG